MSKRLIAFDIDGTVFYKGLPLSERLVSAFKKRHEAGDIITVSTGRCGPIIPACVRALPYIDYMILSNGARIVNAKTGEIVFERLISLEEALKTYSLFKSEKSGYIYYSGGVVLNPAGGIFVDYPKGATEEEKEMFNEIRRATEKTTSIKKWLLEHKTPIEKIAFFFKDKEEGKQCLERINESTELTAALIFGEMELTAKGISKGTGIKRLSEKLSIEKDNIITFGDSGNDLSMKKYAGCFVAMGNAEDFVKEAADIVTAPVWEDGVAAVLETL